MVWQGAFFTTVKGAKRRCPLCQKHADLRHVLLECQWWRGRGPSPPPWQKLRDKWPAESLWVRGLPPSDYTALPSLPPDLLLPSMSGIWSPGTLVDAAPYVFGTDATGTTSDARTRVVVAAAVACTLTDGQVTEVGRITQVLPPGTSVVQGEALALALLLRHTTGQVEVTADCRPAILQAGSTTFREAHANVWEDVWEEKHRLLITWHPSHRTPQEYVQINDLADRACKDAAAAIPWKQHAAEVAQIDELVEEVNHFLADRAWKMLTGTEAPPLDVKPRHKPRGNLPPKRRNPPQLEPKTPQAQNRPAPGGGANKKQRLETLLASEHLHGHRFAWSHTNPNNHSLKCSTCSLFIQQTHPTEIFSRLEAQPCAHRPIPDLGKFNLHQSHSFYNMGAVLLCTKCFAVHKPGQLTPFKVVKEPCEGASRAHARRRAYWAQRYLLETTAPANLFGNKGEKPAAATTRSGPARPSPLLCPPAEDPGCQDSEGSRVVGPTPSRQMPSQMHRHSRLRPKQKLKGCRVRLKSLLVLPLRLPRALALFLERFHRRPQPQSIVLVRLVVHVLAVARSPNLSSSLRTGRNLTLPCSPSSRSFSWPKPEKLARATTLLKTVLPLLPRLSLSLPLVLPAPLYLCLLRKPTA